MSRRAPLLVALLLAGGCGLQMDVPAGFLRQHSQERGDLRAVTAEGARVWVREFTVEDGAALDFWTNAVAVDLRQQRGYVLGDPAPIRDGDGREGRAFTGNVVVGGQRCGYFLAVFLLPASWLPFAHDRVRTVEFAAPEDQFAARQDAVRAAVATLR